jgi:hypothetical protein
VLKIVTAKPSLAVPETVKLPTDWPGGTSTNVWKNVG